MNHHIPPPPPYACTMHEQLAASFDEIGNRWVYRLSESKSQQWMTQLLAHASTHYQHAEEVRRENESKEAK